MSGQRSDWRERLHANPSRMERELEIRLHNKKKRPPTHPEDHASYPPTHRSIAWLKNELGNGMLTVVSGVPHFWPSHQSSRVCVESHRFLFDPIVRQTRSVIRSIPSSRPGLAPLDPL